MVCNCNQIIDFPLFFHNVADNANIGNGINFGYGYDFSFDYGNGFTSTVTEKLTSNYWVESTCSDDRYTYCLNNPLLYTDESGEFVYINIGLGWSQHGGFSISLGVGVGFANYLSAGISIGYEFKSNNFSVGVNASYAGSYVSAGWDTNSGWNVGSGYSYGVPVGIFNFSLVSAGGNYSQNNGFSANIWWANYSQQNGFYMNPSFGLSYQMSRHSIYHTEDKSQAVDKMEDSCFPTKESAMEFLKQRGFENNGSCYRKYRIDFIDYRDRVFLDKNYSLGKTTWWFKGNRLSALYIEMFPQKTKEGFIKTFNHELTHCYDLVKYGESASRSYMETKSYKYFGGEMPKNIPVYSGNMSLYDLPTYLIPSSAPNIQSNVSLPTYTVPISRFKF